MTMKQKYILIGLDTASILLSLSLLILSLIIFTYSFNENVKTVFLGIGGISSILLYSSIMNIINGEK